MLINLQTCKVGKYIKYCAWKLDFSELFDSFSKNIISKAWPAPGSKLVTSNNPLQCVDDKA